MVGKIATVGLLMNGLLASLSDQQIATYFPHRQFVERHQVERLVRNPGTGEMVKGRVWAPIESPDPIADGVEFPTPTEIQALGDIDWIRTPFDNYILASLIALLKDPKNWSSNISQVHDEILRFESHPRIQYETLFPVTSALAGYLATLHGFDLDSLLIDKSLVDYRYVELIKGNPVLRQRIARAAKQSLEGKSRLVFWFRGGY